LASLKVGLCRDEVYAFCLDIVKSRLMIEAIKHDMTEEECQKIYNVDPECNHVIVNELCE